jgi:hypothetical protein
MRRSVACAAVALFALFVLWKVVPFLGLQRSDVASTPTVTPGDESELRAVVVKGGKRVCVDHVLYAPDARFVEVTLDARWRTGPIRIDVSAPRYSATAMIRGGRINTERTVTPIRPAPREVSGTLCLTNRGRHVVGFFGVEAHGRGASPAVTTVDGVVATRQLSVTLLRSPSRSLWGQMGEIFDRVAAFRPIAGWMAGLLFVLLFLAAPVALAVALGRAAAADDPVAAEPGPGADAPAAGGWRAILRSWTARRG